MIWPEDVSRLGAGKLDVLLTHEAPEGVGRHGVDMVSLLVQSEQRVKWLSRMGGNARAPGPSD
jgi:hypothetical protein